MCLYNYGAYVKRFILDRPIISPSPTTSLFGHKPHHVPTLWKITTNMYWYNEILYRINTVLCAIKVNSNTIELITHTSCYCVLDLLCVISLLILNIENAIIFWRFVVQIIAVSLYSKFWVRGQSFKTFLA